MKFKSSYSNEYTSILKELLQKGELIEVGDGLFIPIFNTEKLDHKLSVISKDMKKE